MRLVKPFLPLLALSALAACATPHPGAAPRLTSEAAGPALVSDLDWHLHQEPPENSLTYGLADSDEVKLKLFCRTASGVLDLAAVLDKPTSRLRLESGGDMETYAAMSEPAGIIPGHYAEAQAKAKDPVFQRFRRLGWIAVWEGDERRTYAAHPSSRTGIERFFAACG
jgi:hypothetical protein